MKRVLGFLIFIRRVCLVVLGSVLLVACSDERQESSLPAAGEASPDGDAPSGETRIAPLAPSVTEIVWLVGGRHALAGVTTADDFPPGVRELPAYSALPIDYETIVTLEPDVVVGTHQVNAPRDVASFGVLGIPVVLLENRSIDDLLSAVLRVGALLDRTDRARVVADSLQARLDSLTVLLQTRNPSAESRRPTALFLISASTSWSFGPESHIHELMDYAGFASITADFATEAPVLSDEYVIQAAPDYIFGSFSDDHPVDALLRHHPSWRTVPAVANGHVYRIDPDLALRPGPRAIQAAWDMAAVRLGSPGS